MFPTPGASGKCRQGEHPRREGAEEQSVAFHLMSPSIALLQKSSPWGIPGSAGIYRGWVINLSI
jgi:hypothetical protein